ncbi:UDP-N-acetylglucosamine 4,6-dehydratase (inverting) [Magnetovibrio blakemorei]|uniref:UDP-N-acetylglucosamine 4,6-dehydratase (Inverting) n=1 Tax=Magnetovibrio blakemorei TaxID=28181 RepID=A0A1E5Q792_9PROT|nr:UDP-N-acetylglucosamine 4,6-dehydratase (inverting) [Magnetovibrio blakemorei]OEJ66321.1 UDP-N-acetylglucosamine 4,6-dehydratase (inverting) [Magnetovibrio blakemorei]
MSDHISKFNTPWPDLNGKNILITGGTGSFGKYFVRAVLDNFRPNRLIIFSRDELKQFEMAQEYSEQEHENLRFFIGDVRDQDRLEMAMRDVHIVIHAAAMKHVPAAEYNPFECIKTNVIGAENLVKAALNCGVQKVIALSTDKAASPLNLYGASKLASDKIFIAANFLSAAKAPSFSVVRYGNVMGSRGSVVPFFEKLRDQGAKFLPITDPRMTRFWVTIEQGINFVLSSLALMHGGEIFVPKIPSTDMLSIAKAIAPNIPTKIIGIRPGEKLHEVMITADDARNTISIKDRYIITPALSFWKPDIHKFEGSSMVDDDFNYASNNNSHILSIEEIKSLLAKSRS